MSHASLTLGRLLGSWTLDPGLLSVLLLAASLYLFASQRASGKWPVLRSVSFLAGLLALALALSSGIDDYSERLLSVHMIQHLLLMLIAPALLLWGSPVRLALAGCTPRTRHALGVVLNQRWVRLLSRPVLGFTALCVVILASHLTGFYELALRDQTVHGIEHAAYFWSGVLFLLPLIGDDPLPRRPKAIGRFVWFMGAMTAMAIPGALLTFANTVRYPFYLAPARALHVSALADQHLAGVVMWIVAGVVMFAMGAISAMGAMLAEERRQRRREQYSPDGGFRAVLGGGEEPSGMARG